MNGNLTLVLFVLLFVGQIVIAQSNSDCSIGLKYENNNQVDPKPLRLSSASGTMQDNDGIAIPDGCLGVFTEDGRKLVAHARSNDDGKFSFGSIPPGKYRLIARYAPFCTANIPIEVDRKNYRKAKAKELVVRMTPAAVDSCSHGNHRK